MILPQGSSLFDGDFGHGFFAQQSLVDGDFWALTGDEIYFIYHDDASGTINDLVPCAVADGAAATVEIDYDFPDGDYLFARAGTSAAGSISELSDSIIVTFASGEMVVDPGNEVLNAGAVAVAGGMIRVHWQYNPKGQGNQPDGWKIYKSGAVVGTVAYNYQRNIVWTSPAYTDGSVTLRLCTYKGTSETAGVDLTVTADATGPAAIATVALS